MKYHVNTGLITDTFAKKKFCPLCEIEKTVENGICRELLGDGCMDDDVRTQVNAKGFCERHFSLLYSMPSKLGLALQIRTRINKVAEGLTVPTNVFAAKKAAKILETEAKSCVVCDFTRAEMIKYYKTIAMLFRDEESFRTLVSGGEGFCISHFSKLLEYASFAGAKSKAYIKALTDAEQKRFSTDLNLIDRFTARHDYRNIGKPLGEAENALPNVKRDLYGKK